MKRLVVFMVAVAVCFSLLAIGSSSYAAPSVAGVWKGKVLKVSPTSCSNLSITLTLIQCGTGSDLVRGTFQYGSTSIPVTGKFRSDGVTLDISGELDMYTQMELTGKYTAGTPATIKVSDMDINIMSTTTYTNGNLRFSSLTLTKQ
ncbi:MAG: hypothetical protein AB9866_07935 [Syntrophobacteraceae bacterium]